jgi:DNA replication and repair protein RecF
VHPLRLRSLSVRRLRNLDHVDLEPGPRFNVLFGDNGQGKTNLLEAMYLLATSKSFRTPRLADIVSFSQRMGSVKGTFSEDDHVRDQSVGIEGGTRTLRIDGKRPQSLASYAVRSPVVVFHPGEVSLSMGAGSERRRLLDRLALYLEPESLATLERYTRAVRSRQKTLETRGVSAPDLSEWEDLMVTHGLAVMAARSRTAERLAARASATFERIGPTGLALAVRYAPSAPDDAESFARELRERRERDRIRGGATVGPHRDDVLLSLGGVPVRGVASQGQHRAVVLALKIAEVSVVGDARGVQAILLLDDVSSELDRERTTALFAFLRDHRGQVFLTTTRPDLIDTGPGDGEALGTTRRDFAIESGRIRCL